MRLQNFVARPLDSLTRKFGVTNHPYPLEGILRPALEFNTAIVSGVAGLTFIAVPQLFMMSRGYGVVVGTVLFGFGLRRLAQGLYCSGYKRLINQMPFYSLNVEDLRGKLKRKNKILLGVGFRWRNKHTQRFFDLERISEFNTYLKDNEENPLGGKPHLHGVGALAEKPFYLDINDRIGHFLLYGMSRVGKTRVLEIFLEQDIASGEAVFLIDPKGDKDLLKRVLVAARRNRRLDDVVVLHLGFMADSIPYNPIGSYQKITEVAGRISTKLPSSGDGQAFANFAWRFVFIVSQAIEELEKPMTIAEVKKHVTDFDSIFQEYSAFVMGTTIAELVAKLEGVEINEEEIPREHQGKSTVTIALLNHFKEYPTTNDVLNSIIAAYSYEKTYYDKITASLLPFLEKLASMGEALSPVGNSPIKELNLEEAITQKKIVVFKLDGLSDTEIAHAVGSMFFADLVSLAGKLYKQKETFAPIFVHADEFNDVIGDDFIPLLNKAGGAGVICHAYTQTDQDIDMGFGDSTKALVAKGNFRTVGTMRVGTKETAEFFTSRLNEVIVKYSVPDTKITDSNSDRQGTSASTADKIVTEKVPLIDESAIMSQPVGQMFISKNGGQIYKVRNPLFTDDLNKEVGSIEVRGLGNMIREINLGTFKFADELAAEAQVKVSVPEPKAEILEVKEKIQETESVEIKKTTVEIKEAEPLKETPANNPNINPTVMVSKKESIQGGWQT